MTMVLLSLIVLALMTIFNSTQKAFRASLTQTDILESGRLAMGLITSDLGAMTPSLSPVNTNMLFWYCHSDTTLQHEQQLQFLRCVGKLCYGAAAVDTIVDRQQRAADECAGKLFQPQPSKHRRHSDLGGHGLRGIHEYHRTPTASIRSTVFT